jgi:hypothetical protein
MAPTTSSPSSPKLVSFIHHRHALHYPKNSLQLKKYKSMDDIMVRVRYVVVEKYDYIKIMCEHCGSGVRPTMLTHDFNVIMFFNHHVPHPHHYITHQPVLLQPATTSSSGAAWWMKLMSFKDEVDEVAGAIEMENSIRFAR